MANKIAYFLDLKKNKVEYDLAEENAKASVLYGYNMDMYDDQFEEFKTTSDYKLSAEEQKRAEMVALTNKLCVRIFEIILQ